MELLIILCATAGTLALIARRSFLMRHNPHFTPRNPSDEWEQQMCDALNAKDKDAITAGYEAHREKNENSDSFH